MENSSRINDTEYESWSGGFCQLQSSIGIAVYVTLLILLAIAATVENLLIIIVILRNKIFRTPSLLLLGILSFIDLIIGCIVTPIKASLTLNFHSTLATAFLWMFLAVILLSLSTVTLVAYDRFFHVYFLERYNFTILKLCLALFVFWLGPLLLIVLIASGLRAGLGAGVFALCYFFFCVLAMLVAYVAMIITLKIQANTNLEENREMLEQQKQAIKTTLIIMITFFLMNFLPLLYIALSFMGIFSNELCAVTFFIMLANSAINPLIYCLRVPLMKEHIIKLIYVGAEDDYGQNEMTDVDPIQAEDEEPEIPDEEQNRAAANDAGTVNKGADAGDEPVKAEDVDVGKVEEGGDVPKNEGAAAEKNVE